VPNDDDDNNNNNNNYSIFIITLTIEHMDTAGTGQKLHDVTNHEYKQVTNYKT